MSPANKPEYMNEYMRNYWKTHPVQYAAQKKSVKLWKQRKAALNKTRCNICGFEVPNTSKAQEIDKPLHGLEHDERVEWLSEKDYQRRHPQ